MEKRNMNISFTRSGSGSISPRITLPKSYLDKLNITQDERMVELILDEEKQEIIIRKKK